MINERMVKYWLSFDIFFKLSSLYKIAKAHGFERSNTLSDYLMRKCEDSFSRNSECGATSHSRTAVDLLYAIRNRVKYEEIKGEIDTLLVAVNFCESSEEPLMFY